MSTIALVSKTTLKYGKEVFCIDTGFGKVFLRTDADDDDKVRIFDSEGTYLDYIEAETFADVADEVGIDFRDAICEYANELALKDNVLVCLTQYHSKTLLRPATLRKPSN